MAERYHLLRRFLRLLMVAFWLMTSMIQAEESPITAVAFTPPNPLMFVTASPAGLAIREWPDLRVVRRLEIPLDQLNDVAFSPDGKRLAIAGGRAGDRGELVWLNWPEGHLLERRQIHDELIETVAWHPTGSTLLTASTDRAIVVLQFEGKLVLRRLAGHSQPVNAARYLPGGDQIVSAADDHSVRLWEAASGKLLRTLDNHTAAVHDVAVRPGDWPVPWIASVSADGTLRFWQPTIGRLVRFTRLPSVPLAVAWTPRGDRCIAACRDGSICVVDQETAAVLAHRPAIGGWAYCVAVAPDGRSVVVGGTGGKLRRISIDDVDRP